MTTGDSPACKPQENELIYMEQAADVTSCWVTLVLIRWYQNLQKVPCGPFLEELQSLLLRSGPEPGQNSGCGLAGCSRGSEYQNGSEPQGSG